MLLTYVLVKYAVRIDKSFCLLPLSFMQWSSCSVCQKLKTCPAFAITEDIIHKYELCVIRRDDWRWTLSNGLRQMLRLLDKTGYVFNKNDSMIGDVWINI